MPSPWHDAITELIKKNPSMAVEILDDLMGMDLPKTAPTQLEKETFSNRPSADLEPDTVISVGRQPDPIHAIVVEVQKEKSDAKRTQLPRYAAAVWLLLRCPVTVLIICGDRRVAESYTEPIRTNLPDYTLPTVVLGPDEIPVMTDPAEVADHPHLAVLSVMAHGRHPGVPEAFMEGAGKHPKHGVSYYRYALNMSSPAVQTILETIMKSTNLPIQSAVYEEGRVQEGAEMILLFLESRGLAISDEARRRIKSCTDIKKLEAWGKRAATVETTADLFA